MMDLYNGWFQKNGGCGYVLKPAVMREEISYFSANTKDVLPDVSPQSLHIRIISGQNLPKPQGSGAKGDITDPYVTIEIFGIPADCAEEKTKTINNNGYNPIFDESFEFQINLPELALIRFAVLDDDYIGDEFIGQCTIPFECMETGYRHIRLLSFTGDELPGSTLFVHIAITNRRGGGKGSKRGLKSSRTHKQESISVKNTGIKCIDETFKSAVGPLKEGLELRDSVHNALMSFKDICGLQPIANIKQGVRLLASRVINTSGDQFSMFLKGMYPHLEYRGSQFMLPDLVKKAMISFNELVANCKTLIENADGIILKLNNCQSMGLQWHDELESLCSQSGLKGKKITKAIEHFAWNVRMLRGQSDLLQQAKKDCSEDVRQIKEAGILMGLLKDTGSSV
uniref:Phosphoinositide phospholipase C n=2 Tax=Octopus bimaculoides TaxID=37653 RepID=A0A0L8FX49_OCTBM